MPLVHGHIRLLAGQVLPGRDRDVGEGHHRAVRSAVASVPADRDRLSATWLAGPGGLRSVLAWLLELDRREPPARADPLPAPQDRRDLPDLLGHGGAAGRRGP